MLYSCIPNYFRVLFKIKLNLEIFAPSHIQKGYFYFYWKDASKDAIYAKKYKEDMSTDDECTESNILKSLYFSRKTYLSTLTSKPVRIIKKTFFSRQTLSYSARSSLIILGFLIWVGHYLSTSMFKVPCCKEGK